MWASYLMKLVNRVKPILLSPRAEWKVIEQEQDTLFDLLISYVAILAAIPEIAHFIGQSLIGGYAPIVPSLSCARSSSTSWPSPWSTSSPG